MPRSPCCTSTCFSSALCSAPWFLSWEGNVDFGGGTLWSRTRFFCRRRACGACRCWYSAPAPALANTCCSLAATGRGERLLCPPFGGDQVLDAPPEMPPPASPPPRGDRAICTRESAGPTQHVSRRIRAASAPSACSSLSSLKGRILSSSLVFGAAWLHLQRKSSHCTQWLRLRGAAG